MEKDYKKLYEEALERAKIKRDEYMRLDGPESYVPQDIEYIFPELAESEDERIRKQLLNWFKDCSWDAIDNGTLKRDDIITWLEKQGEPIKLSEEERNRFAKGVLSECAMSFINYLDSNKRKGKMCVSNGECEDIENAFHNSMWDRLHGYYCKYIDKQDEKPNPYSGTSFEYNEHTWGMCARDYGVDILVDSQLVAHINRDGVEQPPKQEWCEEDEKNALEIKCLILNYRIGNGEYELCSWIDHLKERVQPQPISVPFWRIVDDCVAKCWEPGGVCTNPHRDCINCPKDWNLGFTTHVGTSIEGNISADPKDWHVTVKPKISEDTAWNVDKATWTTQDETMLSDCIGAVMAADWYPYDDKKNIVKWLCCRFGKTEDEIWSSMKDGKTDGEEETGL